MELITGVNALFAAKLILNDRKYQELKVNIPDYLRNWIHKNSESIEKWSKHLCAISYSDMVHLTEKQRCQILIEALQGFEEASLEAKRSSEDYYTANNDDASQDQFFNAILKIDKHLDSLESFCKKKPEHCT